MSDKKIIKSNIKCENLNGQVTIDNFHEDIRLKLQNCIFADLKQLEDEYSKIQLKIEVIGEN